MRTSKSVIFQDYQKTVREPDRRIGMVRRIKIGQKSKLGLSEYLVHLFSYNEDREQWPKPLTDQQLLAMTLKEFGRYDTTAQSLCHGAMNIANFRFQYNHGNLLKTSYPKDNPGHPPLLSLRYDADGFPITGRGSSVWRSTNGELRKRITGSAVQETFEELMERLGRKPVKGEYPDDANE